MLAPEPDRQRRVLTHEVRENRLVIYERGREIAAIEDPIVSGISRAIELAASLPRQSFNCFGALKFVTGSEPSLSPVLEMREVGERRSFGEAYRAWEAPSIVQVCGTYEIPDELRGVTISRRGPLHAAIVLARDEAAEDLLLFEKDSWSGPLQFVRLSDIVTRYFNRSGAGAEYLKYGSPSDLYSV